MKLTTRVRYAARILVCLTMRPQHRARKQDIAAAEGISGDYVEQILVKLRAAGLVVSYRGARGGFALATPPSQITVRKIVEAMDGPLDLAPCVTENCRRASECVTRQIWREGTQALERVFSGTTLAKLADQARTLESARSPTFEI